MHIGWVCCIYCCACATNCAAVLPIRMLVCETFDFSAAHKEGQGLGDNVFKDGKLVLEAGEVVTVPDPIDPATETKVVSACTQTIDGKKVKNGTIVVYGQTLVRKTSSGTGIPANARLVHPSDRTAEENTMVEVFVTHPFFV